MFNSQKINTARNYGLSQIDDDATDGEWVEAYGREAMAWNQPNPILTAFRDAVEHSQSGKTFSEIAGEWAHSLSGSLFNAGPLAPYREHARNVLERLAVHS